MAHDDTWDPDVNAVPHNVPPAPVRSPRVQQYRYQPSPPPLNYQPQPVPAGPVMPLGFQQPKNQGLPWWAWAGFAAIVVMVGIIAYVAISVLPDNRATEPTPIPTTAEPEQEESEDAASPDGSFEPTESIPVARAWINSSLGWEDIRRYSMGDVIDMTSDTQEWKLQVTGVDREVGKSAPGTDMGAAPDGYSYVEVTFEFENIKGDPNGAWVSHILELAIDESTIYSEISCWNNCLASAQPVDNVTTGSLYFLVPDEALNDPLNLLVNPLYGTMDDFLVEIP